jgi:hypothetical protein
VKLSVTIGKPQMSISFGGDTLTASTGIPVAKEYTGAPVYDGEYVVIPLAREEQALPTAAHLLTQDVVVREIPYYEVSNPSGGYTVNIG